MHILLPTFLFPPFCSPGSMRLGRFANRFVERGGRVTVVTAALEDYRHGFPRRNNLDDELVSSLPNDVRIVRTESVRPGWGVKLLNRMWLGRLYRFTCTPDNTRRWHKTAIDHCSEILNTDPVDCIYTSSNPLSAHLIGKELAQRFNIPWTAEFRDPWTTSPFKDWETKLHYRYEQKMQRKILRRSNHVIMNTPVARNQLLRAFPDVTDSKVSVVPNSFEPSITEVGGSESVLPEDPEKNNVMTIAHVGTMRAIMPNGKQSKDISLKKKLFNLINWGGRYSPVDVDELGNSPWYFAQGLRRVYDKHPEWEGKIRLVIAGRWGVGQDEVNQLESRLGLPPCIHYLGVLPYKEAIQLMQSSDALLVNQIYPKDMRPTPVVPAKTYEYVGIGKPILGLLPPGDTRNIVDETGVGYLASPNGPEEIAQVLTQLYQDYKNGNLSAEPDPPNLIEEYRSDRLADQVWNIFLQVGNKNTATISK